MERGSIPRGSTKQQGLTMKLITLGCSLTEFSNWAYHLSKSINVPITNLASSAGSNQLQIEKFFDLVVSDGVSADDIVVWQITSLHRLHLRLPPTAENLQQLKLGQEKLNSNFYKHYNETHKPNIYDYRYRYDILSRSPLISKEMIAGADYMQDLQRLTAVLSLVNRCCKLLVFVGWSEALTVNDRNHCQEFFKHLDRLGIDYIKECYVDWTRENNLLFWEDGWHPDETSGSLFAEQVIMPRLSQSVVDTKL